MFEDLWSEVNDKQTTDELKMSFFTSHHDSTVSSG